VGWGGALPVFQTQLWANSGAPGGMQAIRMLYFLCKTSKSFFYILFRLPFPPVEAQNTSVNMKHAATVIVKDIPPFQPILSK
jgi:hypothetical protein